LIKSCTASSSRRGKPRVSHQNGHVGVVPVAAQCKALWQLSNAVRPFVGANQTVNNRWKRRVWTLDMTAETGTALFFLSFSGARSVDEIPLAKRPPCHYPLISSSM
jgi:hypothetical protein